MAVWLPPIHVSESRNFPLDGCSTDEMDIMVLHLPISSNFVIVGLFQYTYWTEFIDHLLSFPSNESTPRIMFAQVDDRFSASDPLVNVSGWKFLPSLQEVPYGLIEEDFIYTEMLKVQDIVEQKVAFTKRLFSEMGGVRKNATHVAIIILEATGLSQEEIRSITRIMEQQNTDIKIFAFMLTDDEKDIKTVVLKDALIANTNDMPSFGLVMAICDQCKPGYFQFKHTSSVDYLSCYEIREFRGKRNYDNFLVKGVYDKVDLIDKAVNEDGYGSLVSMETYEELEFLQATLTSYFMDISKRYVSFNLWPAIPIGLKRAGPCVAKPLKWFTKRKEQLRPLVVNKWLPGKPSGGYASECVVWQISWDRIADMDAVNVSGSNEEFVDGWVDVGCTNKSISFGLYESTLPRRVDEFPLLTIQPANEESFNRVLNKQDFAKFGENLVSISANIDNAEFRKFLRETSRDIPVFVCSTDIYNVQFISYLHVCDNIDHCINRGDESICASDPLESLIDENEFTSKCYGVLCCNGLCLPLQLVNDGKVDCWICDSLTDNFTDERVGLNKYLKKNETCAFICNNDQCVHFSQLNDGHTDCIGPEGPLDETVGKLKTADTCYNMLGHKIWAPMCVYVKDRFDKLLGCRDMSHLKNCTDFECPEGYVQCPNNYCIPQHYVLDGSLDCPTGEDEQADIIGPCTGNVACWNSKICLHPDLVCDGHRDCPHGDDEVDCSDQCSEGFRCVAGTVTLADYNRSVPLVTANFSNFTVRYLDLSGLDLSHSKDLLYLFYFRPIIMFFKCSSCKINNFEQILNKNSELVQVVDVSFNEIEKLDGNYLFFHALENLRFLNMSYNRELFLVRSLSFTLLETLDLSHTALASIDDSDIGGLRNLKHLDLSFTLITSFHENSLQSNAILQTLDLRGLLLDSFHEDFFNGLAVSQDLYTDSYQLCCPQVRGANIPAHTCHAPDDAISSCFDLIGIDVQRVLLWVVAVLAVLGNITVIVYRVIWDRSVLRTGYGLFVTNLGISDFIIGIYLFIIAGADYYYRGVYVLHDQSWRESVACMLAGFLATLSSETSMLFIFLISLDRFLVMKFPFGQIKFTQNGKNITLAMSWVFGFLLALTPIIFRFDLYSSNAVCLGLPLTTKRVSGWEFSFGVFIALNMSLCLVIASAQREIFRAMSENRITGTESSTSPRRIEDIMVAKQLSLVALSCFLCWFPIGVMGLLSLSGHEISNDVFAWTTVIVLPINSAANPILYTIPAVMAKWEKFKRGGKRSR